MNYQKIYSAFIADRREKEMHPMITYVEKHHIVPRAKGGDDQPENLIYLTPEDHFFAHLLLAKIHGGTMWAPIKLMAAAHRQMYGVARRAHGFARREAQKALSGENCYAFDRTEYDLIHLDGREVRVQRGDMPAVLGVSGSSAHALTSGKISSSAGWSMKGVCRKENRGQKGRRLKLKHVDGRLFEGTQADFCRATGLHHAVAGRVQRGVPTKSGWGLA